MSHLKDALSKYQEIINNLEFARDLQKSFLALGQEVSPDGSYDLLIVCIIDFKVVISMIFLPSKIYWLQHQEIQHSSL